MGNDPSIQENREHLENPGGHLSAGKKLRDIAHKYLGRHFRFQNLIESGNHEKHSGRSERFKPPRGFLFTLTLLKAMPPLCMAAFGLSFFWDIENVLQPWQLWGIEIQFDHLIRILSVSGIIGFATNYVAIKMLFKPVKPRPIFGQGLIPAQRDRILDQLAKGMHDFILNEKLIRQRIEDSGILKRFNAELVDGVHGLLSDEEFRAEFKALIVEQTTLFLSREEIRSGITDEIDSRIEENLGTGFKGMLFRTYRRIGKSGYDEFRNNLVNSIPAIINEGLDRAEQHSDVLTDYVRSRSGDVEKTLTDLVFDVLSRIDIHELLFRQMEHFDEQRLEQMVWSATSDQLVYIQLLGTVLGVLGGLIIWQPILLGGLLGGLLLIFFLLDGVLFQLRKS